MHQRSGPGETGYLEGPKDDGEVPGLQYEDVQTRVQEAGGTGGGADEGWLSGVCSGSRGKAGSGTEWARGVQGEGRDSVACYGRKLGEGWESWRRKKESSGGVWGLGVSEGAECR